MNKSIQAAGTSILASLIVSLSLNIVILETAFAAAAKMGVSRVEFGRTTNGVVVDLLVLTNSRGMTAKIMTYGATLVSLQVPDRHGHLADVVLGLDDAAGYLKGHPVMGSTIGRFANRIGGASFRLGGVEYALAKNNGKHSIHGGPTGFQKRFWRAEILSGEREAAVRFSYHSADGEEGFPGNLAVTVTYRLTEENALKIEYEAKPDKDTPVNLTNHSYFNLGGHDAGDVLSHVMWLAADRYTVVDDALIPTGEIASVKGGPLDFTSSHPIGERITELPKTGGYDHNYVLNSGGTKLALAARVSDPKSGRVMECWTTEPGVQLYTANGMKNFKGRGGAVYQRYAGLCLETQHFPDSVNQPAFPSCIVKAGEIFRSATVYQFSNQ